MTTRPHTDDRPAVDAGDDDELWMQVACSWTDPTGPDVVGRPRPGRDRRGRARRDAPIARGTRRAPPPPFVRPPRGDATAGHVPPRSAHPTRRSVRPRRGRSRHTGAARGSRRRCAWPGSPAAGSTPPVPPPEEGTAHGRRADRRPGRATIRDRAPPRAVVA